MADRVVHFHPLVAEETEAIRSWYAERNPRIAELFLHYLDIAVARIRAAPASWPQVQPGVHRYVFRKFPFSLVYQFTAEQVEVIAVAHHRRRPGYWSSRHKGR